MPQYNYYTKEQWESLTLEEKLAHNKKIKADWEKNNKEKRIAYLKKYKETHGDIIKQRSANQYNKMRQAYLASLSVQ